MGRFAQARLGLSETRGFRPFLRSFGSDLEGANSKAWRALPDLARASLAARERTLLFCHVCAAAYRVGNRVDIESADVDHIIWCGALAVHPFPWHSPLRPKSLACTVFPLQPSRPRSFLVQPTSNPCTEDGAELAPRYPDSRKNERSCSEICQGLRMKPWLAPVESM